VFNADLMLGRFQNTAPGGFTDLSPRRDYIVTTHGRTVDTVVVQVQYTGDPWVTVYEGPITALPVFVPRGARTIRFVANNPATTSFALWRGGLPPTPRC